MKQFCIKNCGLNDSKVVFTLKGVEEKKEADLGLELVWLRNVIIIIACAFCNLREMQSCPKEPNREGGEVSKEMPDRNPGWNAHCSLSRVELPLL